MEEKTVQTEQSVKYKDAISVYEKLLEGVSSEYKFLFGKETDAWIRKRMQESEAFCEDMLQEEKSLTSCGRYVKDLAKKEAGKASGIAIDNETVFEWIEDYIHRDEKAYQEEQKKKEKEKKEKAKKEAEERKKKASEKKEEKKEQPKKTESGSKDEKTPAKEEVKTKHEPKKKENDAQMTLFDFM